MGITLFNNGSFHSQLSSANCTHIATGSGADDNEIVCVSHSFFLVGNSSRLDIQHHALRVFETLFYAHEERDRTFAIHDTMVIGKC